MKEFQSKCQAGHWVGQEQCLGSQGLNLTEEAVPGPSVFPSGDPGVSGNFWGSQEGCQGPLDLRMRCLCYSVNN